MLIPPAPDEDSVVICLRVDEGDPAVPSIKMACSGGGEELWVSEQASALIKRYPQTKPMCVEHGQQAVDGAEDDDEVVVQFLPPSWDQSKNS